MRPVAELYSLLRYAIGSSLDVCLKHFASNGPNKPLINPSQSIQHAPQNCQQSVSPTKGNRTIAIFGVVSIPVRLRWSNQQPRRVLREKVDEHDEHLPAVLALDRVTVVHAVGAV
jgi:hypothetical protein